ncbi:MAG: RsmF rRNA methyltransferase first C-terminal domain-containing protein [Eubacteriales bacterium]|nr:RsmF rRNA methyltransferase first C-terminal domain-containing protein [Eubacteriales bacterium]
MTLPLQFTRRMSRMLGEEYPQFLAAYGTANVRSLRINPLKTGRREFLEKAPFLLSPVAWEENGFYYGAEDQPGKHPLHEAGVYYIQEASAMAPAAYLGAVPGERVLDLCAAPGGKSTQLGAAMKGEGLLVCNEINPSRAKILSENVERMGIGNALVTSEGPDRLAEYFPEYFDRILVDAPCSGEGMFRKHEEACSEWSPENVELCAGRQDMILDCAARMLAPGGRMVYSTCTFAPEEDEESVGRFLHRHSDFSVEEAVLFPGMERGRDWNGRFAEQEDALARTVRLWPHRLAGEGHYLAVLRRKKGPAPSAGRSLYGVEKGLSEKECSLWTEFERENLTVPLSGIFLRFGDQLYLAPEQLPALKGLKVLRPGLHLGTVKKGRFEPSHALALYLAQGQAKRNAALPDWEAAKGWIGGMTRPLEGEKGWYLVTAAGYSLGWGKLAGGILKNHYPKGLRKIL